MTIRPFKISNGNLFITRIQTHRGEDLIQKSIKIPRKFWKKLLSHPITAFGYGISHPPENKELPNPKFDRTDVIRALDFWIEHWVYQNKKDYILEGTVNKDFELTVRELIEFREAVLKMPADTQFVRQKIRVNEVNYHLKEIFTPLDKKIKQGEQMVEFTENVLDGGNSVSSTVDQFCYVVRKMTYKEYMERQYELYTYNINFRGNNRFDFGDRTPGSPNDRVLEIDGQNYNVIDLTMTQGTRDPMASADMEFFGRPRPARMFIDPTNENARIFSNMIITEMNVTISRTVEQELTFYDGRATWLKMTLINSNHVFNMNDQEFNEITFPGQGFIRINGRDYITQNEVEVTARSS